MSLIRKIKKAKQLAIKAALRYVRDNKSQKVKDFWVGAYVFFRPKMKYDLSQPSIFKNHSKKDILKALNTDGIYNFGKVFSDEEIDAFKETLKGKTLFAEDPTIPYFLKEDAPADASIIYYKADDYLAHDLFIKLHYDTYLLDVMQDFLGCKPVINEVGLFNSLVRPQVALKENQKYHRDASDMRFLAIALYFTDVDTKEDGPFSYVLRSAKEKQLVKSKVRYTDEEVEEIFGKDRVYDVLGKRGTMVIADNSAFHRGRQPLKNERLVYFLHVGVSNIKKPLTKEVIITDPEKIKKLEKYSDLMDNIAYGSKK